MKILFDENISIRLARSLREIAGLTDYQILHVRERVEKGTPDTAWIRGFAADGGTAFVSADRRILTVPIELQAIIETGLISYFLPSKWQNSSRWFKASHLALWWPRIVQQTRSAAPGESWELPIAYNGKMKRIERP